MIPKGRLDALTDGVFAFAMTLLVLNLALPEGFRPANDGDLIAALRNLDGSFIAYVVSFFVLGLRWMGQARTKEDPEIGKRRLRVGGPHPPVLHHALAVLDHARRPLRRFRAGDLDLRGEHDRLVAGGAQNSFLAERDTGRRPEHTGRVDLAMLAVSALASVAVSLVSPRMAMWAYALNAATPLVRKWTGRT